MLMHFPREQVERLLAHTVASEEHKPLYDAPETAKPGLWLIGDEGVYLMSNGIPPLLAAPDGGDGHVVAYAAECDPTSLTFDAWWDAKRASFGGDDGSEFLDAAELRGALASYGPGEDLMLEVLPTSISLVLYRVRPPRATR